MDLDLIRATISKNTDLVKFILERNESILQSNDLRIVNLALEKAIEIGATDIAELLRKNKEKINIRILKMAIREGKYKLALDYLAKGININNDNYSIFSYMILINAEKDNVREDYFIGNIKFLLEKGASYEEYQKTLTDENFENDPFYIAVYYGFENIVDLLIKNGANVNALNGLALITAANRSNLNILKLLISNGADVNARDGAALKEACLGNKEAIVDMLLNAGAPISNDLVTAVSQQLPRLQNIYNSLLDRKKSVVGGYKNKYLKYKAKYLELKKQII